MKAEYQFVSNLEEQAYKELSTALDKHYKWYTKDKAEDPKHTLEDAQNAAVHELFEKAMAYELRHGFTRMSEQDVIDKIFQGMEDRHMKATYSGTHHEVCQVLSSTLYDTFLDRLEK